MATASAIGGPAPSLPLSLSVGTSGVLGICLLLALRCVTGRAAKFVIAALWVRYVMSAFHGVTYGPVIAGLSINALGSITITAIGLLIIDPKYLRLRILAPIYAIIAMTLVSATLNAGPLSGVEQVVKFLYLMVLLIASYEALQENGAARFLPPLLVAFAPLLVFQILSILTNTVKASELDGSRSFIGGYNHEAAFSVSLATAFFVLCFIPSMRRWLRIGLGALLTAAIVLANYRTTIIAVLPLLAYQLIAGSSRMVYPRQRLLVFSLAALVGVGVLLVSMDSIAGRFGDLGNFLAEPGRYFKPVTEYSVEERRLLSGRAYIWSGYLHAWLDGGPAIHILGFGPDSWSDRFRVYPHNTGVAFLYELGLVGLGLLVLMGLTMMQLALRAPRQVRADLLIAHFSFFLLNMATMALWQIEGVILYALICALSLHFEGVKRPISSVKGGHLAVVNHL